MNLTLQILLARIRRNLFVTVCIVLIVILGSANYFIWQKREALTSEHAGIQQSGEDMLLSLTSHSRITTELAAVKEALTYINANLINEADLPENLGYFYKLENISRTKLENLSQLSSQPVPAGSLYKTVPFSLRATGTYRQVMRLLRELETGPRLAKINTYSITGSGSVTDAVTLDLNLQMLARP